MEDDNDELLVWAIFRLMGLGVDPDEVTARLNLVPSYVYRAGTAHPRTGRVWSWNMWYISSEQHVESDDIEAHIAWILDQIEPVRLLVQEYAERDRVTMDLSCLASVVGNGGVILSAAVLGRIAAMNLDLGLEIRYVE